MTDFLETIGADRFAETLLRVDLASLADAAGLIGPFFAVVLIGWLAGRFGIFNAAGLDGLNAFIFNIALPPLLFRAMSQAPEADAAAAPLLLAYATATLALYTLARLTGRGIFGLRRGEDAVYAHLSVNGNVGFLGLPLAAAALGPAAALPTALILTTDIVLVMTLTSLSLEAAGGGGKGPRYRRRRRAIWGPLRRALINPITGGAIGGAVWGYAGEGALGLSLPGPAISLLDLLAQAAAPAALFATGATLAHRRLDRRAAELGSLVIWKLAIHPLAIAAILTVAAPDLPPLWFAAAVLAAACPASNNAVIFAGVHRVYEARASAVVLLTTALSAFAYAAILGALRPV